MKEINNNDKVDIIITQERYNELLNKENKLKELIDSNSIILGYRYLDMKSPYSILDVKSDSIEKMFHIGKGVTEEFKAYVNTISLDIIERIDAVNEYRLFKIEQVKESLREEIEDKKRTGRPLGRMILDILGIKKYD